MRDARSRTAAAVGRSSIALRIRARPSHACSSFGLSSSARRYPTAALYGRLTRRYASARRTHDRRSSSSRDIAFSRGSIASAKRRSRRIATPASSELSASRRPRSVVGGRPFAGAYGLKRWPSACALSRIRSTAAAITSELSSIGASGGAVTSTTAAVSDGLERSGRPDERFPKSPSNAVKTSPLMTRCRTTGGEGSVRAGSSRSMRPQTRHSAASGLFSEKQPEHRSGSAIVHLGTDDRGDLKSAVLEHEGGEPGLVVGSPHFHDADPPLHLDVGDRMHLELEDAVREEGLVATRLRRLDPEERRVGRGLRQDDRRRAEVPEPLE